VLTPEDLEPLDKLLRRHGLDGIAEEPFPNDGWSGASMTVLRRGGGDRFVLKRDSLERDWIARSTRDCPLLREAWFAGSGPALPSPLRAPYLGVARDGDDVAILMPDLTGVLLDWDAPISVEALDRVLAALAELHSFPWRMSGELPDGPWCPLRERITLICRASLERSGPARDAVADRILPGWDAFDRLVPREARDLLNGLGEDPGPLLDALAGQQATLLHGDLKLANVGLADDGTVDLVDWQMVTVGPIAVELGWFLVSNVASLPLPAIDVIDRYRSRLAWALIDAEERERWVGGAGLDERGIDAAILVGLLLRGWRKGYDAEAGVTLASGVSARDDLGWWCERASEASARLGLRLG
jgi:hypothetical protein